MNRRSVIAYMLILGIVLGLFFSLEQERRLSSAEDENRDELIRLYEEQLDIQRGLLAEQELVHAERQKQRDEYLEGGPDEMMRVANLRSELNMARSMAGFAPLVGSGLEIRMTDAPGIDYATATSEQIIHDSQLRFIVDWLKIQEVYGIAINGERVTGQSKIICNGPTVQVNRVMHGMPYVIEAVTSPDLPAHLLKPYLENLDPIKKMREMGIVIEIKEIEAIHLPAFEDQQMINEAISILSLQPPFEIGKPVDSPPVNSQPADYQPTPSVDPSELPEPTRDIQKEDSEPFEKGVEDES